MSFDSRRAQHDDAMKTIVKHEVEQYGFSVVRTGIEIRDSATMKLLSGRTDRASRMIRYGPDMLTMRKGPVGVFLELKTHSRGGGHFNYEADSFKAIHDYNGGTHEKGAVVVFVDLLQKTTRYAWVKDIVPREIIVPKHHPEWVANEERMKREFPGVPIRRVMRTSGSGTPFFTIEEKEMERISVPFQQLISKEGWV